MEIINNRTKSNSYIPLKYSYQSALIMEQKKEAGAVKVLPVPSRKLKPSNPVCVTVEEHHAFTLHLTVQYILDVSS